MANTNDANIVAEITLSQSFVLDLKIQIYEELLKLLRKNSEYDRNTILRLNVDKASLYMVYLIEKLKNELEKPTAPVSREAETESTKAPITKPASAESISGISL